MEGEETPETQMELASYRGAFPLDIVDYIVEKAEGKRPEEAAV
jgi:hypothetical protein